MFNPSGLLNSCRYIREPYKKLCYGLLFISLVACCFSSRAQPADSNGANVMRQRKNADPLDSLPEYIQRLTWFGERPDISPDSKDVVFMSKAFGDVMKVDVTTRRISCLTCHIPSALFLRAMHLSNGDYLLMGPDHFENTTNSKANADLWYLNKSPFAQPVKIGQQVSQGIAVSKKSMKIAFTERVNDNTREGIHARLVIAELDLKHGAPVLINRKVVMESREKFCIIEAQDFYSDDNRLTFFCYNPEGGFNVMGLDLVNKQVTHFSDIPNGYAEPEGIFPDGLYTTVEMDLQCSWLGGKKGSANLDIWKLKLDGSGKNLERLTYFNDYETHKAANPVISSDGRFMAFQAATTTDPAGMARGIMIYWFRNKK